MIELCPWKMIPRQAPSKSLFAIIPLITIACSVLFCTLLFAVQGSDPILALYSFFIDPFTSAYNISEILIKASPLILIAQGLAIGFRAKVWNIGAEGQLIIGAIVASLLPIMWPQSDSAWLLPGMIVAGMLGGMAWAAIAAFFRSQFNASEIIVTLMLNQIALQILFYLITGPLRDPHGYGFPQSVVFPDAALYPLISSGAGLRANISVFLTIFVTLVLWIFVSKSFAGYRLLVGGLAAKAARYAGFSASRGIWTTLLIGGAVAGLAGVGEISGPIGKLQGILSPGYGFAAIIVAFLGNLRPVGIFFAGLFMAVIYVGGDSATLFADVPASTPIVFQSSILVFYMAAYSFVNYRIVRRHPHGQKEAT